jgi:hypothetical protein
MTRKTGKLSGEVEVRRLDYPRMNGSTVDVQNEGEKVLFPITWLSLGERKPDPTGEGNK